MKTLDWNVIKNFPEITLLESDWKGAVLFLLDEQNLYMIKRSESMPSHAGQLAFFGGNRKHGESLPEEVVIREFVEESGIHASAVLPLARLNKVSTARGQWVIPVVAKLNMRQEDFLRSAVSNGEWDDLISIPLEILRTERWNYAWRLGDIKSSTLFFPLMGQDYKHFRFLSGKDLTLWGASARMIWNFFSQYDELRN